MAVDNAEVIAEWIWVRDIALARVSASVHGGDVGSMDAGGGMATR